MNLQDHIHRYLELVARADKMFETIRSEHGGLMDCKPGCDDCCNVYYELSLIEAFVISGMFRRKPGRASVRRMLRKAQLLAPLFLDAKKKLEGAASQNLDVLEAAALLRLPCPLNEEGGCEMYEHRPITCRLYGVPQKIGDRVVSCPRTGFRGGEAYPTVDVDEIQARLSEYSREFLRDLLGVDAPEASVPRFFMAEALRTEFTKDFFLSLRETFE